MRNIKKAANKMRTKKLKSDPYTELQQQLTERWENEM